MRQRRLLLNESMRRELIDLRDHAAKAYLRERAAALLKVADGVPAAVVGREKLLRHRKRTTVCEWIDRYQSEGLPGLQMRPGRGRKPAFSPSDG